MLHLLLLAPLALPAFQDDAAPEAPAPPVAALTTPRAFLGVQISATEGLGLRVDRVVEGSAAGAAGLAVGDVLAAFNGTDLSDPEQLQELIAEAGVGAEVRLTVLREDAVEDLSATLRGLEEAGLQEDIVLEERVDGPLLDQLRQVQGETPQIIQLQGDLEELRGQLRELHAPIEIATLAPVVDDRPFLGVYIGNEEGPGIQLDGTVEGSGAASAGIQQGDRLQSVGGSLVDDMDSLRAVLERYSVGDTVEVTVERGDQSLDLLVELGGRPTELEEVVEFEETLGDGWVFEGVDMDELEEFEFDMDDLVELEEFEFGDGEWSEHGDGERIFLHTLPGVGDLFELEWSDEAGHGAFKGQVRNHFEHDRDGWQHGGDSMPDWARELRQEMNEWRRDMERDMQSLRQRVGDGNFGRPSDGGNFGGHFGGGRWSVRAPQGGPETQRRPRLRSGAAPRTWVGHFSPDGGGGFRSLDLDQLHRSFLDQHGHFSDQHGEGHAERREVHVDSDGRRSERRFRGVRNGDGWEWTPLDGGGPSDLKIEVDRMLGRNPEFFGRDAEIEVEVHVEREVGRDAPRELHSHGDSDSDVDAEIEALKRRLDELEAQRSQLRERLKELKQRR